MDIVAVGESECLKACHALRQSGSSQKSVSSGIQVILVVAGYYRTSQESIPQEMLGAPPCSEPKTILPSLQVQAL